jgi:hypothetical protein
MHKKFFFAPILFLISWKKELCKKHSLQYFQSEAENAVRDYKQETEEFNLMDKDKLEKARQKKQQELFNSGTNTVKPKNQNQEHNVRKEGFRRQDFD